MLLFYGAMFLFLYSRSKITGQSDSNDSVLFRDETEQALDIDNVFQAQNIL